MILQRLSDAASGVGRNDPCPCGSGRKYKQCCLGKLPAARPAAAAEPAAEAGGIARIARLCAAGRLLEATRLAQELIARRPADAAAHAALGLVHLHAGRAEQALPCFMQAVRLAPEAAEHHRNAGFTLAQLGRDGEAIAAFQHAVARDPRDAEALDQLGMLLQSHDRRDVAIDCWRRAAAAAPDTALGRINRAKVMFAEADPDAAEAFLRQTIALHPEHSEAKRFLANHLRERGRFAEAVPLLEELTEANPTHAATAYFDLAMSQRVAAADQPMLQQMRALLEYRPLPRIARRRVHFALGKALDDLGDYGEAMRHFDAGNRFIAEARQFDHAHFGASVHRLISRGTAEFFHARQDLGSASELPVLILGMPRSGTTLVEQIVSSHADVAGGDELSFWNHAAEEFGRLGEAAMTPAWFQRIAADYTAVLRRIGPTALRVSDKMPGNILWIGLFHLVFPRGRVIHCRRHPVDTCLSNYFADFASPMPFAYSKADLVFYYRWYRRLMAHWHAALPAGTILDVDYEALVADPGPQTRRMIEFLGLDWDAACLHPEDNRRSVKTASNWQARQPVYRSSAERWRRYEPWLGELRALLDDPDGTDMRQPVSDNPAIATARRLRDGGRYDEALAALQEALRATPTDPVMYSDAGTVCLLSNSVELAVDCFERAIGLSPDFAIAHYNLGAALERQGRIDEAMAALRRAIALAPEMGRAHSRLGNLLHAAGDIEAAGDCFRRAADLLTDPAERALEQAKLALDDGSPAEAEKLLRRVIDAEPGNALAHVMLGDVLGQSGRFEDARALLRRATEIDPERVGAWHALVMFGRLADADRPLLARLEELLARGGGSDFDRSMLHFALGKAYDDLQEPAAAIGHFDRGNALEARRHQFDRDAFAAEVDRLIAAFTPGVFAAGRAGAGSDLPVCIVGLPRSGSTLVEQIVSAHPAVAAGGVVDWWSRWDGVPGAEAPPTDDYLALLRRCGPDAARVTDKNPFNFLRAGLIHLALPRARVIHCRRDPIDTCLSLYFTRFATPLPFAYDRGDLACYYRHYARLMAHWRAVLPAEQLFEVDYEKLVADPERQTRALLAFCGLDWNPACLTPERNQRVVRTASLWQVRQPMYRSAVARWRRYAPWLGELATLHEGAT